jgi:hypothetical protein
LIYLTMPIPWDGNFSCNTWFKLNQLDDEAADALSVCQMHHCGWYSRSIHGVPKFGSCHCGWLEGEAAMVIVDITKFWHIGTRQSFRS